MPYTFCIVIISPLSIFSKALACFQVLDMPSFILENFAVLMWFNMAAFPYMIHKLHVFYF